MMPKVTLLGTEGGRYDLVIGVKSYVFRAGRSKLVPVSVALVAKKLTNERGRPLFDVESMPTIVEKQVVEPPVSTHGQNAPAPQLKQRQMVFESWPSEYT